MANLSSFLHRKINLRDAELNITTGLLNSLAHEGNKFGFSRNQASLKLKNMNSTRIPGAYANQDHKRGCFEKLVVRREQHVEDVSCGLEVEVIDDTALIEVTAAVTGFKNRFKKETVVGYRNNQNDGQKKSNKGSKKQSSRCSMKCVNEKKSNSQAIQDHKSATEKKISEPRSQKVFKKTSRKVKAVYQRKVTKNLKLVEEQQNVENQNAPEKIVGEICQETEINLEVSNGNEKELIIESVETETVNDNNDAEIDTHTKKNELEDQNMLKNTTVESKKVAYLREEMEALRFVDDEGQKSKWTEVYGGFTPTAVREYIGLLAVANNRQPQQYNNCGSTHPANAILSMPPLCSSSNDRKFSYSRAGFRVNFH